MDVMGVASELQSAASLAARGTAAVQTAAVQTAHRATLLSVVTPAKFHPTANALPGGSTLLALINGIAGWAVLLALAGLVIGAALWAIGSHSQNYQQSYVGRRAVLVSGIAALLIGAAPTLINFFFNTGHHIVNPLPQ